MRDQLQRRGLVGWQMVFGDGQVQADAEDDADAFRCGSHISGTSCTVRDGSCGKRNHFGEHAAQFLAVDENVVRPFEHDVLAERAAAIADGRDNALRASQPAIICSQPLTDVSRTIAVGTLTTRETMNDSPTALVH